MYFIITNLYVITINMCSIINSLNVIITLVCTSYLHLFCHYYKHVYYCYELACDHYQFIVIIARLYIISSLQLYSYVCTYLFFFSCSSSYIHCYSCSFVCLSSSHHIHLFIFSIFLHLFICLYSPAKLVGSYLNVRILRKVPLEKLTINHLTKVFSEK